MSADVALPRLGEAGGMFQWCTRRARAAIGVDLGQTRDYTAVAVLEEHEVKTGFDPYYFQDVIEKRLVIRHLQRLPRGTSYKTVVECVRELEGALWASPPTVVVDGTGVGRPVVDMLRDGVRREVQAVTITGGDKQTSDNGYWRVPKRDLVGELQVVLEEQRLYVPKQIEEAETLVKELRDMQVKVGPTGKEQFGAWREGSHDDLVFAVALAYWWLGQGTIGPQGNRLFW